jgi:hypothetical protein
MVLAAAVAYFVGTTIGLRLDIRATISASVIVLLFTLGSGLMGWMSPAETIFDALGLIAALQAGYVSIVILGAMGMVEPREIPAQAKSSRTKVPER